MNNISKAITSKYAFDLETADKYDDSKSSF